MATSTVSDHVLDEIWLMMHMAAEMGVQHKEAQSADEAQYMLEAEVEADFLSDTEDDMEDDFLGVPMAKREALVKTAETLMHLGDEYNKELQKPKDIKEVADEIADYIKGELAPKIDKKLQAMPRSMSRLSASDTFQENGMMPLVYGVFKSKVEDYVGPEKELAHIGLISQITKGVAQGLEQSLSGVSGLLATMATNLIKEKYSGVLQGKKELTQIVHEKSSSAYQERK